MSNSLSHVLFPPNSLRRLVAKGCWLSLKNPGLMLRILAWPRIKQGLRLFIEKEYVYLEVLLQHLATGSDTYPKTGEKELSPTSVLEKDIPSLALCIWAGNKTDLKQTLQSLLPQSRFLQKCLVFVGTDPTQASDDPALRELRVEFYPPDQFNLQISKLSTEYVFCLLAGTLLHAHALPALLEKASRAQADVVYSDEDYQENGKRGHPWYKPNWSPELFESTNYIGMSCLVKTRLAQKNGKGILAPTRAGWYELMLRVTAQSENIQHVAKVLYTQGEIKRTDADEEFQALQRVCQSREMDANVLMLAQPGTFRVKRKLSSQPLVSIIIPTAFRDPRCLQTCLRSLAEKTTYLNREILLVDNSQGRMLPEQAAEFQKQYPALRRVPFTEPFNYSRMNNCAAAQALGEYLVFLNDDTEVITPDWIEGLLEHAQRPEIGMVGCRLWYPDRTLQHAGVFLVEQGVGARHAFRFLRQAKNSYHGLATVTRNCSAVTFACAMTPARVFKKLGGLEEQLQVECNDIDYCLRVWGAGLRVVWTPFSELYHHELVSRRKTHYPKDMEWFWKRWGDTLRAGDPYYNPHLSQDTDFYTLKK